MYILYKHINNNGILSTEQYGFRRNLPTEIASHKLTYEVLQALSYKMLVGGIFCDLGIAIDCVNH